MDLLNIFQVSFLSKFMNPNSNNYDYILITIVICYYFMKFTVCNC